MVDVKTPVEFGAGSNDEGTEDVAEDKDRDDKGGKKGVGGLELGHYLRYTGSEHGRCESTGGKRGQQ